MPDMLGFSPDALSIKLEGQPPSGNHRLSPAVRWSKPKDGQGKPYIGWRRSEGVENYMLYVTLMAKRAMPTGWKPASKIRVSYLFNLDRDMDCDNAMKVISDALAIGLGTDDKRFLPCVMDKRSGIKDPSVMVYVENLPEDYQWDDHR
jgi:Holliday junction resolvase RusA-like endonuclease